MMRAAGLIIQIDLARDVLLRAGERVPLGVFRGVSEIAHITACPEIAVVVDIGREDVANIAVLILEQESEQYSVSDAAVGVGRDLGDRVSA